MYLGQSNDPTTALKYRLGPVIISGGDITKATAVLSGGSQTQITTQWTVQFELNGSGSDAFGEATTKAVTLPPPQNQIAIVVDREIISAPRGRQPDHGRHRRDHRAGSPSRRPRTSRRELNAGALPVELTRQSVQTVSPTLGQESLHQGIVAGLVGLALLFLYLLFYYRLLGIVAWFGMSIWAILALALVSVAGEQFALRAHARGRRGPRDLAGRHRGLLHRVLRAVEGRGALRQDGRGRRCSPPSSARTRRSSRPTSSRGSPRWSCTSRPSARCAGSPSRWASRRCSTCSSSGSSSGRRSS